MSSRAMRGNLPSSVKAEQVSEVFRKEGDVLTGWVSPNKRAIRLCLRHEHAIVQHVHVGPSPEDRTCHPLLILRENEIGNSALGIVVSPVILLVPVGVFDGVVCSSIDIVLYLLVSCNLVRSNTIEELVPFSNGEAVRVHPSAPDPIESSVQVFLTVLTALNKTDVGQLGYVLCAFGGDVASKHSNGVTAAVRESFRKW